MMKLAGWIVLERWMMDERTSYRVLVEEKKQVWEFANQMDSKQRRIWKRKRGDMVEEYRCQSSLYMHISYPG